MDKDKYNIQESMYEFPYHYIPHFDARGCGQRFRTLSWGLIYLCYQKHIMNLVEEMRPSSLLEAGCGDGFFVGSMKGIANRVGADMSEASLRFARAFHPDAEFFCGDIADIDKSYDVVVAIEVLEHVPDEQVSGFLRSLADRTTKGGKLIICVPTKVLPLVRKHYRHYDIELLDSQIRDAGVPLKLDNAQYIYRNSIWIKLYNRLTINSLWYFDPVFLRAVIWKFIWNKLRVADAGTGEHMVAILEKTA